MKNGILIVLALLVYSTDLKCQFSNSFLDLTGGYTTVKVKMQNFSATKNYNDAIEISIDDWTTSKRRNYFAKTDSLGLYTISFYVNNFQDVLLTYKNQWYSIFVLPNDTLTITIDENTFPEGNTYSGRTAGYCKDHIKYIINNQHGLRTAINPDNNKLPPADYIKKRDSIYNVDIQNANSYINTNNLDSFFGSWIRKDVLLDYRKDVLNFYFLKHDPSMLDSSFFNSFDYADSSLRFNSSYSSILNSTSCLLAGMNLKSKYIHNAFLRPKQDISTENKKNIKPMYSDKQFQIIFFNNDLHSINIIHDKLFKQSLIGNRYLSILERQNIDIGLDSVLIHIEDSHVMSAIISNYDEYKYRKGLINSITDKNDGLTLLDSVKNKYKGHVILLDFWGTWCVPCYSQMKQMKEVKKAFKDKGIVYVYFCCKSPKDKWQQKINELKIEGEHFLLTPKDFAYMSRLFNITSVPRYVIIDRKGKVVNDNAPHPYIKSLLINELMKYLKD